MVELPSGTVTFLFTDIEGSTRLWEEHPESMRLALGWHDEIASSVIREFAGTLVKNRGEGDSLFAVFRLASDAVAAACALQSAFTRESWPDSLPIRVRMALHTGEAGLRVGDYYGTAVNRCARLRAISHGGQILLSDVTHDLCRDSLPSGSSLKPLGEHRLKDLGRPETVFQVCNPSLPFDFAPLRSLDNPELPNNLPQQVTSFIGREKELSDIRSLMDKTRLLTLIGSGGCGKTRLALQAGAEMLDGSGHGVWLVELAALSDSALVPQAVASVLGVKEQPNKSLTETLVEHLTTRHILLVLDNCEHLRNACASLGASLLRNCPRLLILATGREGLGIAGEQTYRVPSLTLPDPKQIQTLETLGQYEAVQLFVERAMLHRPDFAVTNQNAPALAAVCFRLDGIPLAVELAAARVRSLSVEEVNQRLDQRFRLLTGGSRSALPRQQTLRSLIDWSYDLLSEVERNLLCRLSVFAGGWTLEAAEKVCSDGVVEDLEVLDLLASLSDKSLIVADPQDGFTRYRMLETVRQYAHDRLLERKEADTWRSRHRDYLAGVAEAALPPDMGPPKEIWFEWIEAEQENLRAALHWCAESGDGGIAGLTLCQMLLRWWVRRGYYVEADDRITAVLAHPDAQARTRQRAMTLRLTCYIPQQQGQFDLAQAMAAESLSIWRDIGDRQGIARGLSSVANVASYRGDYAVAWPVQEEALELYRETGNRSGEAFALNGLGCVAQEQGDLEGAVSLYREALVIYRELGDGANEAWSLCNLGQALRMQGDTANGSALLFESLALSNRLRDMNIVPECLQELAHCAEDTGNYQQSVRLLAAVTAVCAAIGARLRPYQRVRLEAALSRLRLALGDDIYTADWATGAAMTMEQAVAYALKDVDA